MYHKQWTNITKPKTETFHKRLNKIAATEITRLLNTWYAFKTIIYVSNINGVQMIIWHSAHNHKVLLAAR